jgi:ABC-type proline/glycine betaine transport system ATPase subunit
VATTSAPSPGCSGWDKERIRARVDELLELVSLDPADTRTAIPTQLSGGQRQRIGRRARARGDPPLMLMDEPFGAIDPINRERLQNEFLRLQREIRKTIVFVTHDIDEAIKMGDRIAVLKKGGILAQYASPAELLMYPKDEFVEDFVGADRALKRSPSSGCATSTCGRPRRCARASRSARCARSWRRPTSTSPSWSTTTAGRRLGLRARPGGRASTAGAALEGGADRRAR